ncbi:hypothetical protein F4820DRAFT_451621 [Hypoxylon rubiginosum]|uniref:Uncharacterized protein n=1 Tax=Hypoxylon rubiginosum TaxID=110542 RepID=A0ACB9YQU7_9PEZI|nr:hypothetical protein F4820DRAFT_451621 [Hypoxylon rubiginosum]
MKFTAALLSLAGLASAAEFGIAANPNAKSFADLGNGFYTVPIVNGTLDYASAVRDTTDLVAAAAALDARDLAAPDQMPGKCVPQFPTRKTTCRARDIRRADYLRAYANFLQWIETGPDDGWLEKRCCKSVVFGLAVVSACSKANRQPTCKDEVAEAMCELDEFCAEDDGGDIMIRSWAKQYGRHNVRDGDGLQRFAAAAVEGGDEVEVEGEQDE